MKQAAVKFHIFDHIVKDLNNLECFNLVSSSAHESFNIQFKRAYRTTLQHRTALDDIPSVLGMNIHNKSGRCTKRNGP